MAISNREKQRRHRVLNAAVLLWYEHETGISSKEVRERLKFAMKNRHFIEKLPGQQPLFREVE